MAKSTKKQKKGHKNQYTIMQGLQKGERFNQQPEDLHAELWLKKMLHYKKKTSILSNGTLKLYASIKKIQEDKPRFMIDLGLSVVSYQQKQFFSINTDEDIHRFKVKSKEKFDKWIDSLRKHRLYRQDQLTYGTEGEKGGSSIPAAPLQEVNPGIPAVGGEIEHLTEIICAKTGRKFLLPKSHGPDEAFVNRLNNLYFELNNLIEALEKLKGTKENLKSSTKKSSEPSEQEKKLTIEYIRVAKQIHSHINGLRLELQPSKRQKDSEPKSAAEFSQQSTSKPSKEKDEDEDEDDEPDTADETPAEQVVPKQVEPPTPVSLAKIEETEVPARTAEETQTTAAQEETATAIAYRAKLPVTTVPCNVSMWSFLKIGRDFTKLSFPIEMFEPLGNLQVMCEDMEYSNVLDEAALNSDMYMRMAYVAAFAVSRYSSTKTRSARKPFVPFEGETYEMVRDDLGWCFVSEQVQSHPSVSACAAKGNGWEFHQSAYYEIAFWGKWIEAEQKTPVEVVLTKYKERYVWNKVVTSVHNLYSGTKYMDHHGKMNVKCSNGVSCKLTFAKLSNTSKHQVTGEIYDKTNKKVHSISGQWSSSLNIGSDSSKKCIWTTNQLPAVSPQYYGFTAFAITLNEMTHGLQNVLPPTDTRFRPDQRLFEEGKVKEAQQKKKELEDKEHKIHKSRTFTPKWFTEKSKNNWQFTHRYWDARKNGFAEETFNPIWQ